MMGMGERIKIQVFLDSWKIQDVLPRNLIARVFIFVLFLVSFFSFFFSADYYSESLIFNLLFWDNRLNNFSNLKNILKIFIIQLKEKNMNKAGWRDNMNFQCKNWSWFEFVVWSVERYSQCINKKVQCPLHFNCSTEPKWIGPGSD